jgi:chromosome segregation ATPase
MNKEELNKEIEKLKVSLEAHEEQVKDLQHDLKTAKQRLEDVDKPKLTNKQFTQIHDAIESAIENFDFSNCNNYEPEFEMDYDGKVGLAHITFDGADDLAQEMIESVERLFGVADESDDDEESPSE